MDEVKERARRGDKWTCRLSILALALAPTHFIDLHSPKTQTLEWLGSTKLGVLWSLKIQLV